MRAALALLVLALTTGKALCAPDFDVLLDQARRSLEQTGVGGQAGERIELERPGPDGWAMRLSAAWDGSSWRLLALRLHQPERSETATPSPGWLERYRELLSRLQPEMLVGLEEPELFEVPVPALLPIMPEEVRSRQFMLGGFWYQARWFNAGGPDEFARWQLRSFELVALPPRAQ